MQPKGSAHHIGPVQMAIILAAAFTAGVHIYLAVTPYSPQPQLRLLFLLAALGYIGAAAATYVPVAFLDPIRPLARLGLEVVAVSTIIGYFVVVGFHFDTLALVDKIVEGLLVILVVVDGVRARTGKAVPEMVGRYRSRAEPRRYRRGEAAPGPARPSQR